MTTIQDDAHFDAVVAGDGSGNFKTINEAIAAAPLNSSKRHVIYIKAGIYKEFVMIRSENIALVGDGMDKTVITGSRCNAENYETPKTAIVSVYADGFIARDLSIENTAGPRLKDGQAVALVNKSDRSVVYRCALTSFQDTLYAWSKRQFYRECRISGTVDFIFGHASAVFQKCDILARLPLPVQKNTITAQGRDRAINDNSGFVFQQCTVAAAADLADAQAAMKTYLGCPWKSFSRTIFMQSTISSIVDPEGWVQWDGVPVPDTLYYAEYSNNGPGADVSRRVHRPGFHVITDPVEASAFTVENFINGNDWLPSTGVEYTPGL